MERSKLAALPTGHKLQVIFITVLIKTKLVTSEDTNREVIGQVHPSPNFIKENYSKRILPVGVGIKVCGQMLHSSEVESKYCPAEHIFPIWKL